MTAALVIIALVMVLAGGGALAGAVTVMRIDERNTKRRVNIVLTESDRMSAIDSLEGETARKDLVRSILGVGIHFSWASKTSTQMLVIAALAFGVLVWVVLFLVLHVPVWLWATATLLSFMAPPQLLLRFEQAGLEAKFVDVFPDAIDMIVRMLRAGLPMTVAIAVVGREAASPVREVFAAVSDQMTMGASFDKALAAAGREVTPQDFKFFTAAAALQQSTGGNLAVTLEMLAEIIRKRRAGRMKAKAVTAEVRMSAYVLGAMPFLVVAGLMVVNPTYLAPLFTDKRGLMIVGLAAGLLFTGFFTMSQMMKSAIRV